MVDSILVQQIFSLPSPGMGRIDYSCWAWTRDMVNKAWTDVTVQFSRSVVSDSLQPHGRQHTRPPCPSPTPRPYRNSCPLSRWCHLTISYCHALLFLTSIFPNIRVFSIESVLPIRWPMYWSFSFSISPSKEYSGLISFRMDGLDLLAVQRTL